MPNRTGWARSSARAPRCSAHNIETVPRIFRSIRPGFRYERSLNVLTQARAAGLATKSNLILGMGEQRPEISQAMADLHAAGCDLLTITQYLRPTPRHHPVERWVKPEEFVELREEALEIGFAGVMSGPLVRSSYRAGRLYRQAAERRAAVLARGGAPLEPPLLARGATPWNPPLRFAPRAGTSPTHRPLAGPKARLAGPVTIASP